MKTYEGNGYLVHSSEGGGREWKNHKYIYKKIGKNGKWIYYYKVNKHKGWGPREKENPNSIIEDENGNYHYQTGDGLTIGTGKDIEKAYRIRTQWELGNNGRVKTYSQKDGESLDLYQKRLANATMNDLITEDTARELLKKKR